MRMAFEEENAVSKDWAVSFSPAGGELRVVSALQLSIWKGIQYLLYLYRSTATREQKIYSSSRLTEKNRDFPVGPVVRHPPCNAGDACLTPGQGTKIPHTLEQLGPWAMTRASVCKNERSRNEDPVAYAAAAVKSLQSCPTLCDPRRQPIRLPRPWDSPGKNTGVGCHFLLQCRKVKSESEVAQSCTTLSDPVDSSLPGSSGGPWDFPGKSTGVGCHWLLQSLHFIGIYSASLWLH